MAFRGASSLFLLLAYVLVPTVARNFDLLQEAASRRSSEDSRAFVFRRQGVIPFFAEKDHAKIHKTGPEQHIVYGRESEQNAVRSHDLLLHVSELVLKGGDAIAVLLDQNGLPIGLLPSSVSSYSITDDGDFIVSFQKECYVKFAYEVYYAPTISGKISYGTITDLSGIQAKEGFFWVPVTGIRADIPSSKYIYFNVGPLIKKLSIDQFGTIPVCKAKAMALSAAE